MVKNLNKRSYIQTYHPFQIFLHWLSGFLILILLAMGYTVLSLPNTEDVKFYALQVHVILGTVAFFLVILRIIWRLKVPQPEKLSYRWSVMEKFVNVFHNTLNILTLLLALSGIGLLVQSNLFSILFFSEGTLPEYFYMYPPRQVHGFLANVLLFCILLHFIAGLFHQFIFKDRVYERMGLKWFKK